MKLLLTSTGFDNEVIKEAFIQMLDKSPGESKALFIPTALNSPEARESIPVFVEDLLKAGVPEKNIDTYDLDRPFDKNEIAKYDIVFVCPGSPEFLLKKINEIKFCEPLEHFLKNGGVYVGVSAGSDIAAGNFQNSLGYLKAHLETHAKEGSPLGPVNITSTDIIKITDNQAVMINGDDISVIE